MTEQNELGEYRHNLALAFTLGMNCTFHALDVKERDVMSVFNVAKEVADGKLYLGATGAELRLRGFDVPSDVEQEGVKSEQRIAKVVSYEFARFLFEGPRPSDDYEI
ncbi:MAG: hypothetical protein ACYTFA_00635 [Planctomycetota bacterium]|jgi:hypothetical protein